VRGGRGVVTTEAGRAFAEHAVRSLRAVEDAVARRLRRAVRVAAGRGRDGVHAPPSGRTASFRPPLFDTFAIVTRPGARLSAGVRELLGDVETHMRRVAEQLDRSR